MDEKKISDNTENIEPKGSAHQKEIDRLNKVIKEGGRLDDVETEQEGVQIQKAHKDLLVKQDPDSELLRMKLKDTAFPLTDPVKADIKKVQDLFEELVEAKIAIGLAAQQANVTVRVCCVKLGADHITMINPKIIARRGKKKAFESCMSLPCVAVEVERPRDITVEYYDLEGERHILSPVLHKYSRRIIHEANHVDGIMIDTFINKDSSNVRFYLPDWA